MLTFLLIHSIYHVDVRVTTGEWVSGKGTVEMSCLWFNTLTIYSFLLTFHWGQTVGVHLCGCVSSPGSSPFPCQKENLTSKEWRLFFSISSTSHSNLNSLNFFSPIGNKSEGDIPSFYLCLNFKCFWVFLYDDTTMYTIAKRGPTNICLQFFMQTLFFGGTPFLKKFLIFFEIAV